MSSIPALQPAQYTAETLDSVSRKPDTKTHCDEPCQHNHSAIPYSIPPNPLTPDGANADSLSSIPSPTPYLILGSTSPSPDSVVRETLHDIPLPPSTSNPVVRHTPSFYQAHEIPLPPSIATSVVEQVPLLDETHDVPLPPSAAGSIALQTSLFSRAHEIPLPPSTASSVVGESSQFDTAHKVPLPPSAEISMIGALLQSNTARGTPLHVSAPMAMSHVHSGHTVSHNFPHHPDPTSGNSYGDHGFHEIRHVWAGSYRWEAQYLQDRIEQISEWLPHLAVLFRGFGRKSSGSACVRSYQISNLGTTSILQMLDRFEVATNMLWNRVQDRLSMFPLQLGTERIFLVEDLNPALITGLYATFGIGPEMLAEHLNRSEYGSSTYTDPNPSTWNFRSPKNYVSIKWYRPVYTAELVDMPPHARRAFRDSGNAEWEEAIFSKPEGKDRRLETVIHRLTRYANIFRQERPLSSVISDVGNETDKKTLTTIEERVTLYTEQRQGQRIAVALVDPLPYIGYSRRTKRDDQVIKEERILPLPVHPRSPPPVSSVDELLQGHNIGKGQAFFKTHTSMSDDLQAWMTEYAQNGLPGEPNRLFVAILEIVSRDTQTTLSLLTTALSEISLGSMDDAQQKERLVSWQTLIRSYQADLPSVRNSLHELVQWNNTPPNVKNMARDLTMQTDDLISRVEKARQALRAELSILESKRGIAEAEGVAKLTELAFIFIPLTFSASLFSMQVRELEENVPTLSGFVGVCFLFLFLSYGARLAIRSRVVVDRKRKLFENIRRDSALESKDVPTYVFVSWIFTKVFETLFPEGKEVGRWTFAVLFSSAILAPVLALIWTKTRIHSGIKAVLTIVMIILAFVVIYALQKHLKIVLEQALKNPVFRRWFEKKRQRDEAHTPGETV